MEDVGGLPPRGAVGALAESGNARRKARGGSKDEKNIKDPKDFAHWAVILWVL